MSNILSKIPSVLKALAFIAIGWFLHSVLKGCNTKKAQPTVSLAYILKLDSIATQIDSLRDANVMLLKKNQDLTQWVVFYKNQKPTITTTEKTVEIHDTIYSVMKLRDTIEKDNIITGLFDNKKYLQLPHTFALKDDYINIVGRLDTNDIHIDTVGVFNQIILKDNLKKTFWRESHSVLFQNTNPYISSVTPTYIYTRPTKQGEFLKKIGWFTAGLGIGYGASYLKK